MKHICNHYAWKPIFLILFLIILNKAVRAQVPTDSTAVKADTTMPAQAAATTTETSSSSTDKGSKPKHFSIYAGGNSNSMSGSTEKYDANAGVGYHIGVGWEMGGFVYWGIGLRYNNAVYGFNSLATSKDTGDLRVQALDVPVTLGVNFLSFAKIVSLRAYVSAMPSFTLGVNDNDFGVNKDNVNSFIFYGQAGIGASFTILLLDIGYNYGTQSLMKNSVSSMNPGQWFVSLGVRF